MPPSTTLSAAILAVADRLVGALMALARTAAAVAVDPSSHADAARVLLTRLSALVIRLGFPSARRQPGAPPRTKPASPRPGPFPRPLSGPLPGPVPDQDPRPTTADALPRRPGWILLALPGAAPAVAADLAPLLADPALDELLAADPGLRRALRPILRGLGLDFTAPAPPPLSPSPLPTTPRAPPVAPPAPPNRAARRAAARLARCPRRNRPSVVPWPTHAQYIT